MRWNTEQAREGPALTVVGTCSDGFIPDVAFLVAGLGAHPANHRIALRTDESRCIGGELEAGSLTSHDDSRSFATLHEAVVVGNVVVENVEAYHYSQFVFLRLRVSKYESEASLLTINLALFALTQTIAVLVGVPSGRSS